ncbi:MAG: tandem-95 repeat protein [Caldilineaceae bacterium]
MYRFTMKRLLLICLLGLVLPALAGLHPAPVEAAPVAQASCTLPATVTTANQLYNCITAANNNGAALDTITLGADITLTSALPQITTAITLEGAGYAIDGGNSIQLFNVGTAGDLTVKQATLQNGRSESGGGAIYNDGALTLINSTLAGNTATNGGAIFNATVSTVTVVNSTFSDNTASNSGGAIYTVSTLILTNNTIAANTATEGSGIYLTSGQSYLAGNIFAGNATGNNCTRLFGTLNDNGYNLSDDGTCTNGGAGSAINATLALGDLADNGGPTQTHLPGTGSDAIGAIPNGTTISNNGTIWACQASTLFVDQRGEPRPQNSSADCTAGAVEVATNSTTLTIIKDAGPAIGTDFDFTLTSEPFSNYSGSTSGNPFWTRPNEGATCTLSTVSTRYHVQAFAVDTSGNYNLSSNQSGWDGYIHLYQDSFNPLAPCTHYLNGDDDVIIGGSSELLGQFLEAGRIYYFVTSSNSSSDAGNFDNSIDGAGTASTPYGSFTLDDAAPDDGDGVSSTVTYNVTPDTYTITEAGSSIWSLTGATCSGAGGTVSLTDETLSVAVGDGEAVQCTFTNERLCPTSWTVTTADELSACITLANGNESPSPTADTITLGANVMLSTALPQITSEITLEGAGYAIDGGNSVQLFSVNTGGDFTVNQVMLQNGSATTGGGIYNDGTLEVTNSTFFGNSATNVGGGIYNIGDALTVINSTFSGNSSDSGGSGIYNDSGAMTAINNTFSRNSSGSGGRSLHNVNGSMTLAGNLFANSSARSYNCGNIGGTINDWGYNLADDDTCINGGTRSVINATLILDPLADNGGPTLTHLPGAGSDAIGAIPSGATISETDTRWTCDQSATDQRGESRPINVGTACTSGAVEVELPPLCPSWTVTTADELSDCISLANANESPSPTADTITLGADITLNTALPQITSEITLEGANHVIDGGDSVQLFYVSAGGDFTVNQATLKNGIASDGGGIHNRGTLTVTDSTISGNTATHDGGGIYINSGTVTVTDSTISGNTAVSGGGIYNTNSGTVTVTNSTISGNTASDFGGGIYNNNSGTVTVTNSTFSGNSAINGGGIYNRGMVTVTNSTISGNTATNSGGGIYINTGTVTVTNSTISDNSATFGGGIFKNDGTLTVTTSTISGNTADYGGGINTFDGPVTVTNSTISGNTATVDGGGGGIASDNAGNSTIHLAGNILANGISGANCAGSKTDNGYNLSSDGSCGFSGTGSANNATLALGALANNGGPTLTHLPGTGSAAIGAIPNGTTLSNNGTSWTCNQSATDQRGESRPINALTACTAGAVEVAVYICPASWTVTTAGELSACITLANNNDSPNPTADTITLGADITLNAALPQITSEITLEGANHFIDGGNSVQLFYVNSGGDFTVNNATLQNGYSATFGGGIFNTNGTLTVSNSTFSGNTADNGGGGIYNLQGTATVSNSTISGNTASFGGGIVADDGIMTVTNSTISGNTADDGGGIYNLSGTLIVTNSTLSDNSNTGYGGAIRNYGTLMVTNSTFSGNTADNGGGIYNYGTVHLAGSIFARGASGNNCVNDFGTFNDNGYNLSDDATCINGGTGSATNATLALGALADNGGPTQTHLPGAGSDAIGAIPNGTTISNNGTSWTCDQSATDQRGELRPINVGTACTAGAVEVASSSNVAPVAVDDSATTNENTSVNIAVLANDTDADGDSLTVASVTPPTNGSAAIEVNDTVTYTPTTGFSGSDSFTYTISDGNGGSDTATVTVTVNAVNVAPVAVDDSATTNENTSVNIAVLANDTDADGDSLTVASVTQPTNGSAAIEVNDTVTYTPATGFSGSDSFTYTISDGNGGTATATVTITVNAANNAPVAVDDSATTVQDTAVTIDVLANDSDGDGDALTVDSVTQPTNGTVVNSSTVVTYTPNASFNGSDSFTYTISDGNGGSTSATVTITVNAVNFLPLIINDLAQTNEDTAVTVDVLANDSDPDGDPLQIEAVTAPTNGNAEIVNNMVVYTPNTNFNGVDSFTYTANDGNGGTDTATVDITITSVNDAPVAVDDSATTDQETAVTIDVLANDSDVDGDILTVASVTQPANGAVVSNGSDVTYTPDASFSGSDSFTYTVSDGNGGTATATVTVTVNAVTTAFATCGGYDVFETAPGVYSAPSFPGNLIVGTDGYDWLQGTAGPDLILGLQGGDDLWGRDGDDVICGGAGVDIILGQRGNDTLYGDDQPDWLIGGPGNDTLFGWRHLDRCERHPAGQRRGGQQR